MIPFELTAIDLILALSVIVLLVLHITKSAKVPEEKPRNEKSQNLGIITEEPQYNYSECPRGFGKIRNLDEDNSISDKCLGCYRIMECYTQSEF